MKPWTAPILSEPTAEDLGLRWEDQHEGDDGSDEAEGRFEFLVRVADLKLVGEVYNCERGGPARLVARWHCKTSDWRELVDEFETPQTCYDAARARLLANYVADLVLHGRP